MQLKNPCKKCVVRACCATLCKDFYEYEFTLSKKLPRVTTIVAYAVVVISLLGIILKIETGGFFAKIVMIMASINLALHWGFIIPFGKKVKKRKKMLEERKLESLYTRRII